MIYQYRTGSSVGRTPIEKIVISTHDSLKPYKADPVEIFPHIILMCLFLLIPVANLIIVGIACISAATDHFIQSLIRARERRLEKKRYNNI